MSEKNNKEEHKLAESVNKAEVRKILNSGLGRRKNGRGRIEEEKRKSYAEYRERKLKVLEFEKTNTQYLALWPASDKDTNKECTFYNMGGTSAILYVHEIGPRIKRKPVLHHDMDIVNREEKFQSGICSISDIEKLEEKLAEIGIKRIPTKDKDLILFKLHREYPHSEIKEMLKQEQKRLDALNQVLYSKILHPDIHRQIIEMKKLIPPKVKNMNREYREVVGMELMRSLMNLIRAYSEMAHGDAEEIDCARRMLVETDMMLAEVSLLNELQLWEVSFCIRIAENINMLRQLIKGKIVNKTDAAA